MRDKLDSIVDDPAAWSPVSPELSRLDPVRATKATDAVLTMAGTVKELVGLLYGSFRLNFHRFDLFELDLRGHTQP